MDKKIGFLDLEKIQAIHQECVSALLILLDLINILRMNNIE